MLEAKEVVKSFDGFRALDSATLTVPKGTVYGLVGPNGAGKSTIIRHYYRRLPPGQRPTAAGGRSHVGEHRRPSGAWWSIPDDWYYFPQASIAEMTMRFIPGLVPLLLPGSGTRS